MSPPSSSRVSSVADSFLLILCLLLGAQLNNHVHVCLPSISMESFVPVCFNWICVLLTFSCFEIVRSISWRCETWCYRVPRGWRRGAGAREAAACEAIKVIKAIKVFKSELTELPMALDILHGPPPPQPTVSRIKKKQKLKKEPISMPPESTKDNPRRLRKTPSKQTQQTIYQTCPSAQMRNL